jgi:hypothetical protein
VLLRWPSAADGAATCTHCLAPVFTDSATLCCVEGASLHVPVTILCMFPVGCADQPAWGCGWGLPVCGLTTTRQQAAPQEACASCSSCCRARQGRQANMPAAAAPGVWWGGVCATAKELVAAFGPVWCHVWGVGATRCVHLLVEGWEVGWQAAQPAAVVGHEQVAACTCCCW